jgi:serine/threonine-protein kinase
VTTPTLLGDRYRLGERLAAGGMGSVYRAVDETLGRQVAVKALRRELADDPTFLERFRREARAAAALSHPGVAAIYDYGEVEGQPFIVMELVEGENLAERVAARGPLPWQEAFAIGEQVAAALAAAHAHGLVHRDIKPANIMLGRDGRAEVTDFGIAQAAQAATLTRTGMVLGSANYVAPEQAKGGHVGPAADLYSLGCVLFEAVTGETPYHGGNAVAIATQHVSAPVPDPRELRPDLPAQAAALIMRALRKQPDARFPSGTAMAAALAAARQEEDATQILPAPIVPAAPPGPVPSGDPPIHRVPSHRGTPRSTGAPPWGSPDPSGGFPGPPRPLGSPGPLRGVVRTARGRRTRPAAVAVAALVVVALVLLAWPLLRDGSPTGPVAERRTPSGGVSAGRAVVEVPAVVGLDVGEATRRLRALGLSVDVTVAGGGKGRQRVRASNPKAGTAVERGSTVRLFLKGRETGKGNGDHGDGDG